MFRYCRMYFFTIADLIAKHRKLLLMENAYFFNAAFSFWKRGIKKRYIGPQIILMTSETSSKCQVRSLSNPLDQIVMSAVSLVG